MRCLIVAHFNIHIYSAKLTDVVCQKKSFDKVTVNIVYLIGIKKFDNN